MFKQQVTIELDQYLDQQIKDIHSLRRVLSDEGMQKILSKASEQISDQSKQLNFSKSLDVNEALSRIIIFDRFLDVIFDDYNQRQPNKLNLLKIYNVSDENTRLKFQHQILFSDLKLVLLIDNYHGCFIGFQGVADQTKFYIGVTSALDQDKLVQYQSMEQRFQTDSPWKDRSITGYILSHQAFPNCNVHLKTPTLSTSLDLRGQFCELSQKFYYFCHKNSQPKLIHKFDQNERIFMIDYNILTRSCKISSQDEFGQRYDLIQQKYKIRQPKQKLLDENGQPIAQNQNHRAQGPILCLREQLELQDKQNMLILDQIFEQRLKNAEESRKITFGTNKTNFETVYAIN